MGPSKKKEKKKKKTLLLDKRKFVMNHTSNAPQVFLTWVFQPETHTFLSIKLVKKETDV